MGRIGRTFFRVLYKAGMIDQLKAVNDIMPKRHLAYLLQYDTVRGHLPVRVEESENGIKIGDHEIKYYQYEQPADIPWEKSGVEIVVESTGNFTDRKSLEGHIKAGAKHALLTTTGDEEIPLYIKGVNDAQWKGEEVFSIGSCTVNGTAPLIKLLAPFKPKSIYLNVIHAYSARQNILDSYYPEIRRSRASADNIIPLNINLDQSLQRLYPDLKGKIKSITSRVPVPCGVLTDMTATFEKPPKTSDELMTYLKENCLEGIMDITYDPIVSSDILHNSRSLVIDGEFSHLMDNHGKLMVWFDNEWGFSNRVLDWVKKINE